MKIAKATEADINAIYGILGALESIQDGEMPGGEDDEGVGQNKLYEALDAGKDEYVSDQINYFIRKALKYLLNVYCSAHPMRAVGNLSAFLDHENEIVDPDNNTLELHPNIIQGLADTKRLDWLFSNGISKFSKEILFGTIVNESNFRDEIDKIMKKGSI